MHPQHIPQVSPTKLHFPKYALHPENFGIYEYVAILFHVQTFRKRNYILQRYEVKDSISWIFQIQSSFSIESCTKSMQSRLDIGKKWEYGSAEMNECTFNRLQPSDWNRRRNDCLFPGAGPWCPWNPLEDVFRWWKWNPTCAQKKKESIWEGEVMHKKIQCMQSSTFPYSDEILNIDWLRW